MNFILLYYLPESLKVFIMNAWNCVMRMLEDMENTKKNIFIFTYTQMQEAEED